MVPVEVPSDTLTIDQDIRQLKKKHEFTGGAWNYGGTHEFFCWKNIPARAVVDSFSVRELSAFVNASPSMSKILRLNTLAEDKRAFHKSVLPDLKADNMQLSPGVITAVADLFQFIGLNAYSKGDHLSHLWTTVIHGRGIQLSHNNPEQWVQLAARFARALADAGGYILPSRDSKPLELAFLEGVNWASCKSRSFSTRYGRDSEGLIARKDKQARLIGVQDPAGLLSGDVSLTRSVRETLQSYRHAPSDRTTEPAPRSIPRPAPRHVNTHSRVAAAGRSLREAINLDPADEEDDFIFDHDEDIQYERWGGR